MSIPQLFSSCLPGWTSCLETGMIKICMRCSHVRDVLACHYFKARLCIYFHLPSPLYPSTVLKSPFSFWYSSWCFLGGPPCHQWSWQRSLGQVRGLGDPKLTVASQMVRAHGVPCHQPSFSLRQVTPLLCSGHQAQSCDLRRQEGVNDENNRLGAGMKVQLNLSIFASKI